MTTFKEIYTRFRDCFPLSESVKFESFQELSFIRAAIPQFIASVREIKVDYNALTITEDLSEVEKMVIGLYMYDAYLNQRLEVYGKLINVSSDVFKMTGVQDRVKNYKDMIINNTSKLNKLLASLLY